MWQGHPCASSLLAWCHVLECNTLPFSTIIIGAAIALGGFAIAHTALMLIDKPFLGSCFSTFAGFRFILQRIYNGFAALAPGVILLATSPTTKLLAKSTISPTGILGKSLLGLARVGRDLPAMGLSKEALASKGTSTILDLMHFILGGLSSCEDDGQLLKLVCHVEAMGTCVPWVMVTN